VVNDLNREDAAPSGRAIRTSCRPVAQPEHALNGVADARTSIRGVLTMHERVRVEPVDHAEQLAGDGCRVIRLELAGGDADSTRPCTNALRPALGRETISRDDIDEADAATSGTRDQEVPA
jgi:hypothetical protein